ncbi:unnamed protein product [Dicrocoelium dendriticum]|nr:unnamed protein product [Dicrocoelium dendriticum]
MIRFWCDLVLSRFEELSSNIENSDTILDQEWKSGWIPRFALSLAPLHCFCRASADQSRTVFVTDTLSAHSLRYGTNSHADHRFVESRLTPFRLFDTCTMHRSQSEPRFSYLCDSSRWNPSVPPCLSAGSSSAVDIPTYFASSHLRWSRALICHLRRTSDSNVHPSEIYLLNAINSITRTVLTLLDSKWIEGHCSLCLPLLDALCDFFTACVNVLPSAIQSRRPLHTTGRLDSTVHFLSKAVDSLTKCASNPLIPHLAVHFQRGLCRLSSLYSVENSFANWSVLLALLSRQPNSTKFCQLCLHELITTTFCAVQMSPSPDISLLRLPFDCFEHLPCDLRYFLIDLFCTHLDIDPLLIDPPVQFDSSLLWSTFIQLSNNSPCLLRLLFCVFTKRPYSVPAFDDQLSTLLSDVVDQMVKDGSEDALRDFASVMKLSFIWCTPPMRSTLRYHVLSSSLPSLSLRLPRLDERADVSLSLLKLWVSAMNLSELHLSNLLLVAISSVDDLNEHCLSHLSPTIQQSPSIFLEAIQQIACLLTSLVSVESFDQNPELNIRLWKRLLDVLLRWTCCYLQMRPVLKEELQEPWHYLATLLLHTRYLRTTVSVPAIAHLDSYLVQKLQSVEKDLSTSLLDMATSRLLYLLRPEPLEWDERWPDRICDLIQPLLFLTLEGKGSEASFPEFYCCFHRTAELFSIVSKLLGLLTKWCRTCDPLAPFSFTYWPQYSVHCPPALLEDVAHSTTPARHHTFAFTHLTSDDFKNGRLSGSDLEKPLTPAESVVTSPTLDQLVHSGLHISTWLRLCSQSPTHHAFSSSALDASQLISSGELIHFLSLESASAAPANPVTTTDPGISRKPLNASWSIQVWFSARHCSFYIRVHSTKIRHIDSCENLDFEQLSLCTCPVTSVRGCSWIELPPYISRTPPSWFHVSLVLKYERDTLQLNCWTYGLECHRTDVDLIPCTFCDNASWQPMSSTTSSGVVLHIGHRTANPNAEALFTHGSVFIFTGGGLVCPFFSGSAVSMEKLPLYLLLLGPNWSGCFDALEHGARYSNSGWCILTSLVCSLYSTTHGAAVAPQLLLEGTKILSSYHWLRVMRSLAQSSLLCLYDTGHPNRVLCSPPEQSTLDRRTRSQWRMCNPSHTFSLLALCCCNLTDSLREPGYGSTSSPMPEQITVMPNVRHSPSIEHAFEPLGGITLVVFLLGQEHFLEHPCNQSPHHWPVSSLLHLCLCRFVSTPCSVEDIVPEGQTRNLFAHFCRVIISLDADMYLMATERVFGAESGSHSPPHLDLPVKSVVPDSTWLRWHQLITRCVRPEQWTLWTSDTKPTTHSHFSETGDFPNAEEGSTSSPNPSTVDTQPPLNDRMGLVDWTCLPNETTATELDTLVRYSKDLFVSDERRSPALQIPSSSEDSDTYVTGCSSTEIGREAEEYMSEDDKNRPLPFASDCGASSCPEKQSVHSSDDKEGLVKPIPVICDKFPLHETESISGSELKQRFVAYLVHMLDTAWSMLLDSSPPVDPSGSLNLTTVTIHSATPRSSLISVLRPPLWLVYSLLGHPWVEMREAGLNGYRTWLRHAASNERALKRILGKSNKLNEIIAAQLLLLPPPLHLSDPQLQARSAINHRHICSLRLMNNSFALILDECPAPSLHLLPPVELIRDDPFSAVFPCLPPYAASRDDDSCFESTSTQPVRSELCFKYSSYCFPVLLAVLAGSVADAVLSLRSASFTAEVDLCVDSFKALTSLLQSQNGCFLLPALDAGLVSVLYSLAWLLELGVMKPDFDSPDRRFANLAPILTCMSRLWARLTVWLMDDSRFSDSSTTYSPEYRFHLITDLVHQLLVISPLTKEGQSPLKARGTDPGPISRCLVRRILYSILDTSVRILSSSTESTGDNRKNSVSCNSQPNTRLVELLKWAVNTTVNVLIYSVNYENKLLCFLKSFDPTTGVIVSPHPANLHLATVGRSPSPDSLPKSGDDPFDIPSSTGSSPTRSCSISCSVPDATPPWASPQCNSSPCLAFQQSLDQALITLLFNTASDIQNGIVFLSATPQAKSTIQSDCFTVSCKAIGRLLLSKTQPPVVEVAMDPVASYLLKLCNEAPSLLSSFLTSAPHLFSLVFWTNLSELQFWLSRLKDSGVLCPNTLSCRPTSSSHHTTRSHSLSRLNKAYSIDLTLRRLEQLLFTVQSLLTLRTACPSTKSHGRFSYATIIKHRSLLLLAHQKNKENWSSSLPQPPEHYSASPVTTKSMTMARLSTLVNLLLASFAGTESFNTKALEQDGTLPKKTHPTSKLLSTRRLSSQAHRLCVDGNGAWRDAFGERLRLAGPLGTILWARLADRLDHAK